MPSKTGFLNKLGGNVKNWKRRYFVLGTGAAGRQLSYYRSATDNSPLGIIPLVNCRVRLQVEGDRPCTFEVVTPARTYQLQAENSDEMRQWLSAVQEAAGSAAPDIVPCRGKLEGYLLKEGNARIKDWKRRWFVLDGGALTYYKKQHVSAPSLPFTGLLLFLPSPPLSFCLFRSLWPLSLLSLLTLLTSLSLFLCFFICSFISL